MCCIVFFKVILLDRKKILTAKNKVVVTLGTTAEVN